MKPPVLRMSDRERDRAREEGAAEVFPFPDTNAPSLGDPETVEGLVRSFVAELVADRTAYNDSMLDGDKVVERLKVRTDALASVFYGGDAAFTTLPSWNRKDGDGLGVMLLARGFGDKVTDSVHALLLHLADRIVAGMVAHEDDGDDDAGKFSVDAAVDDTVADLLGLSADAEERAPVDDGSETNEPDPDDGEDDVEEF